MYVYIHTCILAYMQIYIIHIYTYTYIHERTRTYTDIRILFIYVHMQAHKRHAHTNTHAHTHIRTHTNTYAQTHTYRERKRERDTHTHTHTHTHTQTPGIFLGSSMISKEHYPPLALQLILDTSNPASSCRHPSLIIRKRALQNSPMCPHKNPHKRALYIYQHKRPSYISAEEPDICHSTRSLHLTPLYPMVL